METFTSHLVPALQERGHQNVVVTSRKAERVPDVSEVDGVPVHRLDYVLPLYNRDLKAIFQAKKNLERIKLEFRPDAIVVNVGGGGPMAFLHLSTAGVAEAPLVVIAHDLSPTGVESPTLRQLFEQASHVVNVSQARLRDARLIAPEVAARMSVIYPCLPWRKLHDGVERSSTPLAVMAGRMIAAKGFDLAVEAFRHVNREIPEARLVLVGDGPIFHDIKEQIDRLGLSEVIRMTGHASDTDVTRLYQEAWVTLVPSRHSESFGLVALEAMQAGSAVVASTTGGLAEVVLDAETGFLVPKEDVEAMAACVRRILSDRDLAVRLGLAGRRRAETHFSWDRCLADYEEILKGAVAA